jgi:hypothetical protein
MLTSRLFDLITADGIGIVDIDKRLAGRGHAGRQAQIAPDSRGEGQRLAAMRRDLARLRKGWRPTPFDLAETPLIDNWAVRTDPGDHLCALTGQVRRHPEIRDGRFALTSLLVAVDLRDCRGSGRSRAFTSSADRAVPRHTEGKDQLRPVDWPPLIGERRALLSSAARRPSHIACESLGQTRPFRRGELAECDEEQP